MITTSPACALFVCLLPILRLPAAPALSGPSDSQFVPFDEAAIILEYNATDADAEVVIHVDADVGLRRFAVINPLGKEVLSLRSLHNEDIGIRKLDLETPEPSLEEILAAFPEGPYKFVGKSVDGKVLFSEAYFSHALPEAPLIAYPREGATGVPTSGAAALWSAGPEAESFFLELENDDLEVDLKSNMPSAIESFGFPEGWLIPDTEYQLGIGARSDTGNLTVVEINFTTGS